MIKILPINARASVKRLNFPLIHNPKYIGDHWNDIIVRWGNSVKTFRRNGDIKDFRFVINPRKGIKLNIDKKESLKLLSQNISTPRIFTPEGESTIPEGIKAVLRGNTHHCGSNLEVVDGPFRVEAGYATEFLPSQKEFRVWFCNNNTIAAKRFNYDDNEEGEFVCRSNWGYQFLSFVPPLLHNDTVRAANVISLDCGAADVLFYNDRYYFTELNSAPACDHSKIIHFFRENIINMCRTKFPDCILTESDFQI